MIKITKREKQILQLLALSVKEMSLILRIKPSTTTTYIRRLYEKFYVNNRVALYIEASKHGFIEKEGNGKV